MRQAFLSQNKTKSDYANYLSHVLIFLQILKKISEHEFALSYTDHLSFFSSGLEYRLVKAGFANYLSNRFIDFRKLNITPKLLEKVLVFFCYQVSP